MVESKTGQALFSRRFQNEDPRPWIISHEDFLLDLVLPHPDLTRGGAAALRRIAKLDKIFRGCQAGAVLGVEDSDYLIVRNVVERIEWPAHLARFAVQLLPHLEAWEQADAQNDAWYALRVEKQAG